MSFRQHHPDLGIVIYTHERTSDARINMEILRSLWRDSGLFGKICIIHVYNGERAWWPKKYLEDVLIRRSNPGHFQGAAEMIDAGVAALHSRYPKLRYGVILAADTWCVKPQYARSVVDRMAAQKKVMATCPWGLPRKNNMFEVGLATDFLFIDLWWAKRYRLFPLDWQKFGSRHGELLLYLRGANVSVEKLLVTRLLQSSFREQPNTVRRRTIAAHRILRLTEREPVHRGKDKEGFWKRRFVWQHIGLLTSHRPAEKAKLLRQNSTIRGSEFRKLISRKDFIHYNHDRTIRRSYD